MSIFLCSCSKKGDHENPKYNDGKKKVTFNINEFEQESSPLTASLLATTESADASYVQTLEYRSFDEAGKGVTHFEQDNTYDNFGTFTDELPAGTYQIMIYGARSIGKKVPFSPELNDIHEETFNTGFYYPSKTDPNGKDEWYARECFAFKGKVTVADEDQNINVSLTRISSIIELELLDETIPKNVARIKITTDPTCTVYSPFPADSVDWAEEVRKEVGAITYDIADRSRKVFWAYPTPANGAELKCKIYLWVFNADNDVLAIKEINNVGIKRNMKTILSGYLFDGISGKSYTVGIDSEWKGVQQELEF